MVSTGADFAASEGEISFSNDLQLQEVFPSSQSSAEVHSLLHSLKPYCRQRKTFITHCPNLHEDKMQVFISPRQKLVVNCSHQNSLGRGER